MTPAPAQSEPVSAAYEAREAGAVVGQLVICRNGDLYARQPEEGAAWYRVAVSPWPPESLTQL